MSAYLYEKVLVDELRKISGDGRVSVIAPDQAIQYYAQFDKEKDKFQLPAIVLSRGQTTLVEERKNQVAMLNGQTSRLDNENIIHKGQNIPMKIVWQVDVLAVDRFTCDEIIRELVFFFTTHPRFYVEVPYDLNIEQNFDIFISPDIEDNSDLVDFPNRGEYFRETLTIFTDNAQLFSSSKQYPTFLTLVGFELNE